ncbi:MAG: hypothetical protein ACPGPC_16350 [Alphaproteobacteria bacterium]
MAIFILLAGLREADDYGSEILARKGTVGDRDRAIRLRVIS